MIKSKQIAIIVLCFYVSAFFIPTHSKANPVAIGLIPPSVIGTVILVLGGTYIAQSQNGGYSFDNDRLHRDMVAFRKYVQDGADIALGASTTAALNLADLIQSGAYQGYESLAQWVDDYFNPAPYPGSLDGAKLACTSGQSSLCTPGKVAKFTMNNPPSRNGGWTDAGKAAGIAWGASYPKWGSNGTSYITAEDFHKYGSTWWWWVTGYSVSYVAGIPDPAPGVPDVINPELEKALAEALAAALALNSALTAALDQVMQDHPDLLILPPTAPITPQDVRDWAQGQGSAAQDTYVQALQDLVSANPSDTQLQSDLARAQAEQAKSDAEDIEDQADYEADVPGLTNPVIKAVDIQPILALSGDLASVFPFGLITPFVSALDTLTAAPHAPSLHINAGIFEKDIDFSIFNGFASFLRSVMSFLLYGLTAFFCVKLFSRM